MYRKINGQRVEIPQEALREIESMVNTPEGANYLELFAVLKKYGITEDKDRAVEIWKMHFVQSIVSTIREEPDEKDVYSLYPEPGGPPHYFSRKVMSIHALNVLDCPL